MFFKVSALVSVFFVSILFTPFIFAADEEIPGVPFQILQDQIDEINKKILPKAYSTHVFESISVGEDSKDIMEISLPKGDYVSNISVSVQYQAENHGFWAECWAYSQCFVVDKETNQRLTPTGVGGNVVGILNQAGTDILKLYNDTTVALRCNLDCSFCPDSYDPTLNFLSGSWTFIEVVHE